MNSATSTVMVEFAESPYRRNEERASLLPSFTRYLRYLLVITLSSASASLAVVQLLMSEERVSFLLSNAQGITARITALGVAWSVGLLVACASWLLARRASEPLARLSEYSTVVAPWVVAGFVPILFVREVWVGREFAFLSVLLAVGLCFEKLLRPSIERISRFRFASALDYWVHQPRPSRVFGWISLGLVLALVGLYIAKIGTLTNVSHMKMATMSSDLAEYDNMFFNALSGHPFRSPAIAGHREDFSSLQGHAEFGLYFLLPFYAISPGAHALLWIQSAVVALTAIPLFLLASARLGRVAGIVFSVVFLMMPAVQRPNFYDFHFTPLGMFFVAWLLFFVSEVALKPSRRWPKVAMYITLAFALLCREDVSIGITVLGVFLILSGALVKEGLILAVIAGFYFVGMKFAIMPLFGTWWFDSIYDDLKAEGAGGFGAVILTLLTNPSYVLRSMLTEPKFLYCLHMTAPILALWLRRPLLWMAVLPGILSTLLVTNRPPMFQSSFQYTYLWIPYVVGASILAIRHGIRGRATIVSLALVAAAGGHQLGVFGSGERILGGFRQKTFTMSVVEVKQMKDLKELIALIPKDASVSATEAIGPHVSARLLMYSLKYFPGHDSDYLLVGSVGLRGEKIHLRTLLESKKYGVIERRGRFVLAKRGAELRKNGVLWRRVGGKPRKRPKKR